MPLFRVYLFLALLLLLSLLLAWSALRRLLDKRLLSGTFNILLASTMLGLFGCGILLLSNFYTYQRLTAENGVATLEFERLGSQRYRIRITEQTAPDQSHQYLLFGDEWQLDARIIKWHTFGTWLGLNPIYRLERISGRYSDPQQETDNPRSVHALSPKASLEIWELARYSRDWLPMLDAYYGSATYMPMADGAEYKVTILSNGLIARPGNPSAETALKNWK